MKNSIRDRAVGDVARVVNISRAVDLHERRRIRGKGACESAEHGVQQCHKNADDRQASDEAKKQSVAGSAILDKHSKRIFERV